VIVVDASVALKWFKDEPGSEAARSVLLREPAVAPELVLAEVLNAGWKAVRLGLLTRVQLQAMTEELPLCFVRLAELRALATSASRIAVEIDHPVYDCFYLALAEREALSVITADTRLMVKTKSTRWAERVLLLS
jgi:predicted nucleic acid-binding protein